MTRTPLVEHFTVDGWQDQVLIGVLAFVALVLLYSLLFGGRK